MHMTLYRKYRPVAFRDVIGQPLITETLLSELRSGKTAHAYLFTGSRGTGKTTCSKVFAKAVNCLDPQNGEPCQVCENCRGIEEGRILDVLEIDAASNNGVDNIRDLREEAAYTPVQCKYRVYIIDEAHMLSQGAFNALLKIMEEPPEHVIFILATTEVHKVPATILSRCQRFDFKRIDASFIADHLGKIAAEEKVKISKEAALLLAKAAQGSVRDALSLMDKCISSAEEITEESVRETVGIVDTGYLLNIADAVSKGEMQAVLSYVAELYQDSKDMERLCAELMELYRDMILAKTIDNPAPHILTSGASREELVTLAKTHSIDRLLTALTVLSECRDSMGRVLDPRTQLEIALLKLSAGTRATVAETPEPAEVPKPKEKKPSNTNSIKEPVVVPEPTKENKPEVTTSPQQEGDIPFENWEEVLVKLAKINGPLYGTLVGSKAFIRGDLVLIDSDNTTFLKLVRENEISKQSLKKAIEMQTGKLYRLGPYDRPKTAEKKIDPLEELANIAREKGIDVTFK